MSKYTLKVIEGVYVEKPPEFISHKRATNFIARIIGLDTNNKFIYTFLEKIKVGRKTYFQIADFIPGEYYVISTKYYSASGNLTQHETILLKCKQVTENEVTFEIIDEEEIIKGIRFKYPDKESRIAIEELQRIEARLKPLEQELHKEVKNYMYYLQDLKQKIEEYMTHINKAEEEKKKLEEELNKIRENTKQTLENQITTLKNYSVLVTKIFGIKKEYDKTYYEYSHKHKIGDKTVNIHIKTDGDNPYYMKVDSTYIFVKDKNPTPKGVEYGFKLLRKIVEDNLKTIQENKPEVPDLNLDQIQELKENYYKLLKDRALKLAKAFGKKKNGTYVYRKDYYGKEIEIKTSARGVQYFKIGYNYIISKYGDPGLPGILYGLKVLSELIKQEQEALSKAQA